MRNRILKSVSVVAILAILLATGVSAARASENITYLGSNFIYGKGLVLWFGLPDGYDASGIAGSVLIDGVSYPLDCAVREDGVLACVAGASQKAIGLPATAVIDGLSFDFIVHEPRPLPVVFAGPWCYSVFDYGPLFIPWGQIGVHCQNHEAQVGDEISFYNPNYASSYEYEYFVDSSEACAPNFGAGYYYPDC
jgi:hypothetical protein